MDKVLYYDISSRVPVGSTLSDDIVTEDGVFLMKRGTDVSASVAEKLKKFNKNVHFYFKDGREYQVPGSEKSELSQTDRSLVSIPASDDDRIFAFDSELKEHAREAIQCVFSGDVSKKESVSAAEDLAFNVEKAMKESADTSINLSELKIADEYTYKHSVDVGTIAMLIGRNAGMDDNDLHILSTSGILHDIGKIDVPPEILNKPAKLTDEEFEIMKKHPVYGYERIKSTKIDEDIKLAVLMHHENQDGSGYPLHFDATKLNIYAEILTVSDVYDALATKRPYKAAKRQNEVIEMMMGMYNKFNPDVMRVFLDSVVAYPSGSEITMSNGKTEKKMIVLSQNKGYPLRPIVAEKTSGRVINLMSDPEYLSYIII